MTVRNAEFEDMKRLGHIMSVSFRTAFVDFISKETLETCAQEENCAALLEGIFREGQMHFLMGGDSGMLVWQRTADGAEIVAIHSLPQSWGTGLGHAMLAEALKQIGEGTVSSGRSGRTNGPCGFTRSTASAGTAPSASASSTVRWKCGM